jgi:hypothetical protein
MNRLAVVHFLQDWGFSLLSCALCLVLLAFGLSNVDEQPSFPAKTFGQSDAKISKNGQNNPAKSLAHQP